MRLLFLCLVLVVLCWVVGLLFVVLCVDLLALCLWLVYVGFLLCVWAGVDGGC